MFSLSFAGIFFGNEDQGAGAGDTPGIGPESTIPGWLESVSVSFMGYFQYRYQNRNRNFGFQYRLGIEFGIEYQAIPCLKRGIVFTFAFALLANLPINQVGISERPLYSFFHIVS